VLEVDEIRLLCGPADDQRSRAQRPEPASPFARIRVFGPGGITGRGVASHPDLRLRSASPASAGRLRRKPIATNSPRVTGGCGFCGACCGARPKPHAGVDHAIGTQVVWEREYASSAPPTNAKLFIFFHKEVIWKHIR